MSMSPTTHYMRVAFAVADAARVNAASALNPDDPAREVMAMLAHAA